MPVLRRLRVDFIIDRMLVRVSYTEDTVSSTFDERQNRTTRHLENEGWREYIVAWRKNRLELYKDHVSAAYEYCGIIRLILICRPHQARSGLLAPNDSYTSFPSVQPQPTFPFIHTSTSPSASAVLRRH